MKIGLLLAAPWVPGSVDMTEYLRKLDRLGHESILICRDYSQGPEGFEVAIGDQQTLESCDFYRPLCLDAVIAFTWFNSDKIISALKLSGISVLIRGDSDGLFSIRQFTAHHIRVRMAGTNGVASRFAGIKHLLQRYFRHYQIEDQARLLSMEATDIAVLETQAALRNVIEFLRWQKRDDLVHKLKVVPHFVADEFIDANPKTQRNDTVVAIGRWEDPQKNAPLLVRTIRLYLAKHPATRFIIVGGEKGRKYFTALTTAYLQVSYTGPKNAAQIRQYLSEAKVLLSSSRWEGSPVVANEALAMGMTIVGTPIPAFNDICQQGFGTTAKDHSPKALALALDTEITLWKAGQRNAESTAAYWRPLLSSQVVVTELARLVLGQAEPALPQSLMMQNA